MATIEFKGERFKPVKLLNLYAENVNYFSSGDVTVMTSGEIFDISELADKLAGELMEVGNKNATLIDTDFKNSLSKSASNLINKINTKKYELKLNNDSITLEEIEDWRSVMKYNDINKNNHIKYNKFITINHSKSKPDDISMSDYGRFFALLYIMRKDNKTKHLSNGKVISKENLLKELDFNSERTYDNFISRLKGYGMLVKTDHKNTHDQFLIINPAYAMKGSQIDPTTYMYFKEDLDELLTPLQIKHLQLLTSGDYSNNMVKVTGGKQACEKTV